MAESPIIVRYADDSVVGFQFEAEASRFLEALKARLAQFGLSLNEEKTRVLQFGRFAASQRQRAGLGRPQTFDFLGFTHICSTKRSNGRFTVKRLTSSKRMRATLKALRQARTDRSGRHMASPCDAGLLQLPRRPRQQPAPEPIPIRSLQGLVARPSTTWAVWSYALGAFPQAGRALCAVSSRAAPLPGAALLRVMTQGRSRMR